jgi:hypothetical protein
MKNKFYGKQIFILLVVLALPFFTASCDRLGEITAFQLWSGNVSLPPPYQTEMVIRGKINPSSVSIKFSDRKGDEKTEKVLELTGEDFEKCRRMVKATKLEQKEFRAGASAFDVTLIDREGKNEMGSPSNAKEWAAFVGEIRQKTGAQ